MFKHRSVLLAACFATALVGTAAKAESSTQTIVISDYYDPFGWRCDGGRLIQSSWCNGSYCDNMIFQCADPPALSWDSSRRLSMSGNPYIEHENDTYIPPYYNFNYNYGWTSDENGYLSPIATCTPGHALIGAYSTGSYSDNVRAICQAVSYPSGTSTIYVHAPLSTDGISDEGSPHFDPKARGKTSQAYFLSSASCTGNFCDNMFYGWTEAW